MPSERLPAAVTLAVDRLQDKSSSVRRYALAVLTAALKFNPFGRVLSRDVFTTVLQQKATDFQVHSLAHRPFASHRPVDGAR